jgi:hypothetical protein
MGMAVVFRRLPVVLGTVAVAAALLVAAAVPASASPRSDSDSADSGSGPALRVPAGALRHSLSCHGDLAAAATGPVLLVPGTTLDPETNFDWNYEPALRARHQPYCTVALPGDAMGDIQVAAEYVVAALRTMHERADAPIQVVGFSQGGMVPRWALKYWPDTRELVRSVIGLDASNHGSLDADAVCALACAPALWQQRPDSRFLAALNAGAETYPGISYTQIYSYADEVVVPNVPPAASSELHTGGGDIANIAVQRVCPGHVAEHLIMGSTDAVGYALVVDALTHGGLASAHRINRAVCATPTMPGVDPATLPANEARYGAKVATVLATAPRATAEPPLRPYATTRDRDAD